MSELMIKGPLTLYHFAAACPGCFTLIEHAQQVFLVESDDEDEPDVYVHKACLRTYLGNILSE